MHKCVLQKRNQESYKFKPVQRFQKGIFPLVRSNSYQSLQRVSKMRKDWASIYSFQSPQITCHCEIITSNQNKNDYERGGRQDNPGIQDRRKNNCSNAEHNNLCSFQEFIWKQVVHNANISRKPV